jgi:hypothetical protein
MRCFVYFLELPVEDLIDIIHSFPVDGLEHIEQLFKLFGSLLIEDGAVLDHVDQKYLVTVVFIVVVGYIVFIVEESQLAELLLSTVVQVALYLIDVIGVQDHSQLLQDLAILFPLFPLAEDVVGEEVVFARCWWLLL